MALFMILYKGKQGGLVVDNLITYPIIYIDSSTTLPEDTLPSSYLPDLSE